MADAPGAWTQFVAELKRRRVVGVAAVHLAASFVVLRAAPSLLQALLLPDRAFRLRVVLHAEPALIPYFSDPGFRQLLAPEDRASAPAASAERKEHHGSA